MKRRIIWRLAALFLLIFTLSACQEQESSESTVDTELSALIDLAASGDVDAQVKLADTYL